MLFPSRQEPPPYPTFVRRAVLGTLALLLGGAGLWWFTARVHEDPELGRPFAGELVQLVTAVPVEAHPALSPDGRWIAYRSDASGDPDIFVRPVDAGQAVNLTSSPGEDAEPAFSPDGRRIAFRSAREGGGIYLIDRDGAQLRRLTHFGATPAWMPDGRHIIFATRALDDPMARAGKSEGWKVEVASGRTTRLTRGDFVQPAVSPSGRRVAYSAYGAPTAARRTFAPRSDIWTMSTDGHHEVPATNDPAMDWSPMWSADGRHLYFISNRGGVVGLWGIRIDERTGRALGDPVAIPSPPAAPARLTRSADGRRLAWSTLASRRALHHVRFNPDTRSVTGDPVPLVDSTPRWHCAEPAPDGAAVAFRSVDPRDGIHVLDVEGGDVLKISTDVVAEGCPRWAPDGARVLFHGNRGDVNALWLADARGRTLRQATRTVGAVTFPAWAPDGTRVAAFDAYRSRVRIFALAREGPATDSVDALPEFAHGAFVPVAWAPDGTMLAGTAAGAVWVYSFETGSFDRLTEGSSPAWLNTSRRLVAAASGRILLVDVPTRFTREILARPRQVFGSPTLSPDNSVLYVTRERSEADIWLLTLN